VNRGASPLRYPGGKACLYDIATSILRENDLIQRNYVEPYSGGCGLALNLLFEGHVAHVHLNDLDRAVWAFWKAAVEHTDALVGRIEAAEITVGEWERQRAVQARKSDVDVVELGFSTFYLNRTNRSGIVHSGGIIGGKSQLGPYKLDCRFNKSDLVSRIRRVAKYRNRISVYNEDAEQFLGRLGDSIPATSVTYVDPPYYVKGSQLYQNAYRKSDHERIAVRLDALNSPWLLTYDNVPPIRHLYNSFPCVEIDIGYSAQVKRRGSEVLVLSKHLRFPTTMRTEAR
jgi:DNA adenine methylase